tara:strand:- start:26629 stop:28614 length:1986 start_codon:yes stop_codon:yes gene_type:complete
MASINLDIDDYNNEELRELLDLPGGYTTGDVNTAKSTLETQLTNKQDMTAEQKRRIVFFLDSAATRLKNQSTSLELLDDGDKTEKHKDAAQKAGTWGETVVPTQEYGSNILIENPNTLAGRDAKIVGGRSAISGDAPPGYLNPVNIRTIMQGITIDSRFRKDYFNTSSSNFSVELPSIQRKVVSLRVAAIELPMSYYALSLAQGNNYFLIHCNWHGAQLEGSRFENANRVGNGSGFVDLRNQSVAENTIPQYNYNFPWIPKPDTVASPGPGTSNVPDPYHGLDPTSPGGCIRCYPVATSQIDIAVKYKTGHSIYENGSWPVGSTELLSMVGQNVGLPGDRIPAWKVTIPDGNYEQRWMAQAETTFIEEAMNNAISLAQPGYLDQESGFARFTPVERTVGSRLRPNRDICFTVDRTSGKGIFATPFIDSSNGNFKNADGLIGWDASAVDGFKPTDMSGSKFENHGYGLRFIIDSAGSLDIETSAQLRLGWQLGFRTGSYWCGGVPYNSWWKNKIGFAFTDTAWKHFYPQGPAFDPSFSASRATIGSAASEGLTLITGPRYCFLAINDHRVSTGPTMLVAYADSTLDDNIITRINLASAMASVHAYQYSDDPGQTTQLNRQREYFGPVDIHRLEITLYDEYGRVLDLNNMDWSFTLAFEKLYS